MTYNQALEKLKETRKLTIDIKAGLGLETADVIEILAAYTRTNYNKLLDNLIRELEERSTGEQNENLST